MPELQIGDRMVAFFALGLGVVMWRREIRSGLYYETQNKNSFFFLSEENNNFDITRAHNTLPGFIINKL
jgi:hypothetical protein